MKKLGILFASVFLLGLVFQSCNNGKTYAEMKEEEREAIKPVSYTHLTLPTTPYV